MSTISKLTLVLIVFLVLPVSLFSQWKWINPLPQGNSLTAVQFTDSLNGYAAGENGTVLKTTDGGLTWKILYIGESFDLASISFVNTEVGYACGGYIDAEVFKTTDGGLHWTRVTGILNAQPTRICFTSEETGILCGRWTSLYKTNNGGTTWTRINGVQDDCNSIFFIDSLTGYIGGDKKIYKTQDGGSTWFKTYNGQYVTGAIMSMHFISPDTGFAAGYATFLKTTDGGQTWTQPYTGFPNVVYTGIRFINGKLGFMTGSDGMIMKTTDGGNHWDQIPSPLKNELSAITFPTVTNGIITGGNGMILRTNDGGIIWSPVSSAITGCDLYDISFTTPQTGYAVGDSGIILKTADAGNSWTKYYSGTMRALRSICFTDLKTGYICGSLAILKTTDAGATWNSLVPNSPDFFHKIMFPAADTGFVAGDIFLRRTCDGGITWTTINNNIKATDIQFLTPDIGFACGEMGTFEKTINGGVTFYASPTGTYENLFAVDFLNPSVGFLGGQGFILKTTDGGKTWSEKPIENNENRDFVLGFSFTDPLHGNAIGDYSLYSTDDGGETWTNTKIIPCSGAKNKACFTSPDTGYVVGSSGLIIKTCSRGINNFIPKLPAAHTLKIYPNPNQGTFRVKNPHYPLAAKFRILSLYGRCIYSGILLAGEMTITISLPNVAPGLYFLETGAGGQVSVEKMQVVNL